MTAIFLNLSPLTCGNLARYIFPSLVSCLLLSPLVLTFQVWYLTFSANAYFSSLVSSLDQEFFFYLCHLELLCTLLKQLVSMMPVPSATIFVRRALSYLMIGQAELALRDAMQSQVCLPEWPTAFYMQALALSKLGMETDAQDMLNDGASFEAKKQNSWRI